ncbi:hypothetical protein [Radiobacillus sp. PE A8.2]|uniref:hypothetical protein n=1 Tax=Radiobacillus sp. PE A8.2 TaxID=3380349 RepID=UPI00388EEC36
MMITAVLNYLRSDNELVGMLGHTQGKPRITAYKPEVDLDDYPYIVVTLTPYQMGLATDQYRCEVRIVTDDALKVEKLTKYVTRLLHFRTNPVNNFNNETIYHSRHSGSGFLFDPEEEIFEQALFFIMKFK